MLSNLSLHIYVFIEIKLLVRSFGKRIEKEAEQGADGRDEPCDLLFFCRIGNDQGSQPDCCTRGQPDRCTLVCPHYSQSLFIHINKQEVQSYKPELMILEYRRTPGMSQISFDLDSSLNQKPRHPSLNFKLLNFELHSSFCIHHSSFFILLHSLCPA